MEPCILFSFAHPDDESFSGAGTAMKYGAAGVRTVLVTATRGERGKAGDPPVCAPEQLAACREEELREAVRIVGFDELHLLDYRDRELADAPPDAIRRSVVSLIRRARPSVVASFDPNGFNVHPDHVAIRDPEHLLGVEVWRQAWGPPLRRRPSPDLMEGLS